MFNNITRNWALSVLSLVCLLVLAFNFPFTSWYTGWDNLHPEFDSWMNLKRGLSSVWQSNQGFGTYGGHGYAATIPHTILTWILSIFTPDNYVRSLFTFLCLFAGTFGGFYLLRYALKRLEANIRDAASLLGSLFYLFNLATAQQFYIQLEAFIVHYAALPWLFFITLKYLNSGKLKFLGLFALLSFLTSTQGFVPPLFFVYLLLLGILLSSFVLSKFSRQRLKRSLAVLGTTFLINAYWLLPVVYYSVSRTDTYLNAYNNLSSTEDFILKNRKYGNLKDVSILRGFIFEAIDSRNDGAVFPIFEPWEQHLSRKVIKPLGYLLFTVSILGAALALFIKKRSYLNFALPAGFLVVLSFLITDTPPFSYISQAFQEIPILRQAFRVAFTKFSIALAFIYALAFAIGIVGILAFLKKFVKKAFIPHVLSAFVALIMIIYSWPIVGGNLLYQRTKLDIPQSYFELFNFFKDKDKNERIANFPQGWNWGWTVYRWGYSGSGFLWYGIEQPIIDRAFDVWGRQNEQYYWELSYAIYSERFDLIEKIVNKYNISWITLDKNVLAYGNPRGYIYTEKVEEYLNSSDKYEKVASLNSRDAEGLRDIVIYRVKQTRDYSIVGVGPDYSFTHKDQAFFDLGNYTNINPPELYYPYRSLFSSRRPEELDLQIKTYPDKLNIISKIPQEVLGFTLELPQNSETFFGAKTVIDGENIVTSIPHSKLPAYSSDQDPIFLNHETRGCNQSSKPEGVSQEVFDDVLRFKSLGAENCYTVVLDEIEHKFAYVVEVESMHVKGKSMQLAVINHDARKADIVVSLPKNKELKSDFIVIPPMKSDGVGYSLNFNNISIGKDETVNDLAKVRLYSVPYDFLKSMILRGSKTSEPESNFFVNYQSFDPGWVAYSFAKTPGTLDRVFPFFRGKKLQGHILYNNWANAWILPDRNTKHIVAQFRPQFLEYFGLALLMATFGVILFKLWNLRLNFPKNGRKH